MKKHIAVAGAIVCALMWSDAFAKISIHRLPVQMGTCDDAQPDLPVPTWDGLGSIPFSAMVLGPYEDPLGAGVSNSVGRPIVNYTDRDGTLGILDYRCGNVTYDSHQGIDISLRDFYEMDEGVPVLCARKGRVLFTLDGNFDRNFEKIDSAIANYVGVQHFEDGTIDWYLHFRKNSIRVSVNDSVFVGDTIGFAGSSGWSGGPHLHFQVNGSVNPPWDVASEPFNGPCQTDPSLWISQPAYTLDLSTSVLGTGLTSHPITWQYLLERPPTAQHISDPPGASGATINSTVMLQSPAPTDSLSWTIRDAMSAVQAYTSSSIGADVSAGLWYITGTLPNGAGAYGTWTVEIRLNGILIATQPFAYDGVSNQAPVALDSTFEIPNLYSNQTVAREFSCNDPDGLPFWYVVSSAPSHGTFVQDGGRKRKFRYTPNDNFAGQDTVRYYAIDGDSLAGPVGEYIFVVSPQWFPDVDGDSCGDLSAPLRAASSPPGYVSIGGDCDDGNENIHPGAAEFCNGVDDNCNGEVDEDSAVNVVTWYQDLDEDGYGDPNAWIIDCDQPLYHVANHGDCNDADENIHAGAVEHCDGIDEDCDGVIDDNAEGAQTWYRDADVDGFGNSADSLLSCSQPVGYVATGGDCDDANPNVTATTWYRDADSDGYGNLAVSQLSCVAVSGYVSNSTDCDDSNAARHPTAPEFCNALDDDCDGSVDESGAVDAPTWYADFDGDGYGNVNMRQNSCQQLPLYVGDSTDCDDGDEFVHPGAGCGCGCNCHADPGGCNGVQDVVDVVQTVNVAFRNAASIIDPNANCPYESTDVNCSLTTDVIDVVKIVNVAFRNANPTTEFCVPCP